MREMKFRYVFKHWKDGDFYFEYITLEQIEKGIQTIINILAKDGYKLVAKDQFVDLPNNSDAEIYDKDIVRVIGGESCQGFHEINEICLVKWVAPGFELVRKKDNCGMGWGFALDDVEITVIGNAHEHPHLLEVTP